MVNRNTMKKMNNLLLLSLHESNNKGVVADTQKLWSLEEVDELTQFVMNIYDNRHLGCEKLYRSMLITSRPIGDRSIPFRQTCKDWRKGLEDTCEIYSVSPGVQVNRVCYNKKTITVKHVDEICPGLPFDILVLPISSPHFAVVLVHKAGIGLLMSVPTFRDEREYNPYVYIPSYVPPPEPEPKPIPKSTKPKSKPNLDTEVPYVPSSRRRNYAQGTCIDCGRDSAYYRCPGCKHRFLTSKGYKVTLTHTPDGQVLVMPKMDTNELPCTETYKIHPNLMDELRRS